MTLVKTNKIYNTSVSNNEENYENIIKIYNKIKFILEKNYNLNSNDSTKITNITFILKLIEFKKIEGTLELILIKNWLNNLYQYQIDISKDFNFRLHLKNILIGNNILITEIDFEKILNLINKEDINNSFEDNYSLNNALGQVFEKIITKKEIGAYYTSNQTTKYISENTILPNIIKSWSLIDKDLNLFLLQFETDNKSSLIEFYIKNNKSLFDLLKLLIKKFNSENLKDVIKNIKIIDISCGSGSFLFYSYKLLYKIYHILEISDNNVNNIFKNNLFGIDIDSEAIDILKFRILLDLIINDEIVEDLNYLENNFVAYNSLLGNNKKEYKKSIFFINKTFKSIIDNGGFDIVLGNPPYLEYRNVKKYYTVDGYVTEKCNNLYAFVLEKNLNILKEEGHMGMIVPISYTSTKRMKELRELFSSNSTYQFCSNFADRPSSLFNGVHQKLNIILLEKKTFSKNSKLYTSSYKHWYKDEKNEVFSNITYIENDLKNPDFYFKIGNLTEKNIINKLIFVNNKSMLPDKNIKTKFNVWLNMRMCFWNKSFTYLHQSNEYKVFNFENEKQSIIFSALLNSNIFFFFWESVSDCWHITLKELNELKFNIDDMSDSDYKELKIIYNELEFFLEKNKKKINSKQSQFEYQHKKAKHLIDKLDLIFGKYFKLTYDELDYLKNYQLKFRMNNELKKYLK